MKFILGILGLFFVGLAMLDLGGVVALVLLVFAFQKQPSGV